jgi:PadR family transcriptional regulator PadR
MAADLTRDGTREFYGYDMARRLRDHADQRLLTAYGTLYRALARLETMGLLQSRWEDPEIPARENRPGRRLYALTAAGDAAVRAARAELRERASRRLRPRRAPA